MSMYDDVKEWIEAGLLDDELVPVIMLCREREKVLAARLYDNLRIEDRVRIKEDALINPNYLRGASATVTAKRTTKITVRFDDDINDPYGKWAGQHCILTPMHIEKIED